MFDFRLRGGPAFLNTGIRLPEHAHVAQPRGRWRILILLCLAQFMIILDVTVANVALPGIGADLELSRAVVPWVVSAYTLVFGGFLLLGGRLADIAGRRTTFTIGLALFTTVRSRGRSLGVR